MYRIWYWAMIDRESDVRGEYSRTLVTWRRMANGQGCRGPCDRPGARECAGSGERTADPQPGAITTRCRATFGPRRSAGPSYLSRSSVALPGRRRPIKCPSEP